MYIHNDWSIIQYGMKFVPCTKVDLGVKLSGQNSILVHTHVPKFLLSVHRSWCKSEITHSILVYNGLVLWVVIEQTFK